MRTEQGAVRLDERIGRFDPDGSLTEGSRELITLFKGEGARIARAFSEHLALTGVGGVRRSDSDIEALVSKLVPYMIAKHEDLRNQRWADMAEVFLRDADAR